MNTNGTQNGFRVAALTLALVGASIARSPSASADNVVTITPTAATVSPASGTATAATPSLPSYAAPSYARHDEQITGRISGFDGKYGLELRDERGFVDRVTLHDGTIITPTGLRLESGMRVTIHGRNGGDSFEADEIDTPYLTGPAYSVEPAYPIVPAYPYGYGYGYLPAYGYGYGFGYPSYLSLNVYYGNGFYGGYHHGGYHYGGDNGYPIRGYRPYPVYGYSYGVTRRTFAAPRPLVGGFRSGFGGSAVRSIRTH